MGKSQCLTWVTWVSVSTEKLWSFWTLNAWSQRGPLSWSLCMKWMLIFLVCKYGTQLKEAKWSPTDTKWVQREEMTETINKLIINFWKIENDNKLNWQINYTEGKKLKKKQWHQTHNTWPKTQHKMYLCNFVICSVCISVWASYLFVPRCPFTCNPAMVKRLVKVFFYF